MADKKKYKKENATYKRFKKNLDGIKADLADGASLAFLGRKYSISFPVLKKLLAEEGLC